MRWDFDVHVNICVCICVWRASVRTCVRACVCVCAWVRGEWNLHCTGTTLCPIVLDLRRDALYSDVAPSIGVTIILQCHVVLLFGAFIIILLYIVLASVYQPLYIRCTLLINLTRAE